MKHTMPSCQTARCLHKHKLAKHRPHPALAVGLFISIRRLLLTESRDRVGGNLTSCSGGEGKDGYLWEEGPSSFQPNDSMLKAAVRNLPQQQPPCGTYLSVYMGNLGSTWRPPRQTSDCIAMI